MATNTNNRKEVSRRLCLTSVRIKGYRPFGDFTARVGDLEVVVGANGAGKTALFEFLGFLRDGMMREIPPGIVEGAIGQRIFHSPGSEKFEWELKIEAGETETFEYSGGVAGPVGRVQVFREFVREEADSSYGLLNAQDGGGIVWDKSRKETPDGEAIRLQRPNQLALGTMTNPSYASLYRLREYISKWRFYGSFKLNGEEMRRSVLVEPEPLLREDGGNLSAVLHYLITEHRAAFDELQHHLRNFVPEFKGLTVKAYGGRGQVIAFWREGGVDDELSLADLSDGVLRLLCWSVLCLQPTPPTLICIDEPDQGVHPRALPLLAGLFEKAAVRTQILLATHSSYFLTQFELARISVMRKENGEARFLKPRDSAILVQNLNDFGPEELELMHRSDELELLA